MPKICNIEVQIIAYVIYCTYDYYSYQDVFPLPESRAFVRFFSARRIATGLPPSQGSDTRGIQGRSPSCSACEISDLQLREMSIYRLYSPLHLSI